jgi:hypothetical protein
MLASWGCKLTSAKEATVPRAFIIPLHSVRAIIINLQCDVAEFRVSDPLYVPSSLTFSGAA